MNGRDQTESWSLVAGDVALDFVNTVGGNDSTADLDAIASYDLLLLWSVRAGTIDQDQADALLRRARRNPAESEEVMVRARNLRSALYAVFLGLVNQKSIIEEWTKVRPAVAAAAAAAEPAVEGDEVSWSWSRARGLDAPLHPLAHAAAALVVSQELTSLRQCRRCRWFFLDQSRNRGRRWCDMRTCGVAEKVERQAERRRGS